jgi:protein O-GlcNAc transferase
VRQPDAQAAEPAARAALGLREDAVVFWCGQSPPKYLPRWDAVWPRIAKAAGACQFVFISLPQASAAERVFRARLAQAFAAAGLDADQYCVFLPRMSEEAFSAAVGAADVFLDSVEWSGCNSTLEAIAHDLPVVTWPHGLMRGRHSAAILQAMDAAQTVARDLDDYVAIAARLAADAGWRAQVRAQVAERKARLWRDDAGVRALEDVLEQAVRG